ncbi:unnamed protein product [Sympodiomycopsis kandeliae]
MADVPQVKEEVKEEAVATPAAEAAPTAVKEEETKDTLSVEEAEKEAFRQVEFYFSDTNLPFDKFLWTLSRKDDGWVPISTIASFKRMRQVRDTLGVEKILQLLQPSELLQVDAENQKVRRKSPLEPQRDAYDRSIYAKGFPAETDSLQKDMEVFFAQFGQISAVRMRREDKKPRTFKGSVFVEFAVLDEMNKFLEKAKAEPVKYQDQELLVMTKDEYCQMKMKEKGIDPSTVRKPTPASERSSNYAPISRPGKFNAFIEMEREAKGLPSSEEARAQMAQSGGGSSDRKREPKPKAKRSDPLQFQFQDATLTTRPDETVDPDTVLFPASSVISFTGAGSEGHWKELKDELLKVAPTSFVEFGQGATEGAAGFKETLTDDQYNTIVSKEIKVGGQPITWSRVDEERAKQFYVDRANFRAKYLIDQREAGPQRFGGGRGGGGFGGRGGGRGGRGGRGGGRGGGGGFRNGEKRKRNVDDDESGTKAGGSAPTLASKKAKEE